MKYCERCGCSEEELKEKFEYKKGNPICSDCNTVEEDEEEN